MPLEPIESTVPGAAICKPRFIIATRAAIHNTACSVVIHARVVNAHGPKPIAPNPTPTTVAQGDLVGAVYLRATARGHGKRDSVDPTPPPLAPTTDALGALVGPVQLRGTGRTRRPRRYA